MVEGTNESGETSEYFYNALGARVRNVQTAENENAGHRNFAFNNGSRFAEDYLKVLSDGRNTWQNVWETEVGTTIQPDEKIEVKNYIVNYLSDANRDIMLLVEGMYTETYRYDPWSQRVSVELDYALETTRGEPGENLGSDIAAGDVEKVWYRRSHLSSTLYAVNADGEVAFHIQYDEWGNPETDTLARQNHAGIDNLNNFTGYTYDDVLGIYFAQNRFYDAEMHRFTQEDPVRSGMNWFAYVGNNPINAVDPWGLRLDEDGGGSYTLKSGETLYQGNANMSYNAVATLQKALNNWASRCGYARLDIDGSFGPLTESAVISFQMYYENYVDHTICFNVGVVNDETWRALGLNMSADSTTAPPAKNPTQNSPIQPGWEMSGATSGGGNLGVAVTSDGHISHTYVDGYIYSDGMWYKPNFEYYDKGECSRLTADQIGQAVPLFVGAALFAFAVFATAGAAAAFVGTAAAAYGVSAAAATTAVTAAGYAVGGTILATGASNLGETLTGYNIIRDGVMIEALGIEPQTASSIYNDVQSAAYFIGAEIIYVGSEWMAVQSQMQATSNQTLDWTNTNDKGQSALDHVNHHATPNYHRENHGVFNGEPKTMVEQAWANRGAVTPILDGMGGEIFNIPYQNAGYQSGLVGFGQQMDYITIVVKQGTSTVWSAFPSFGGYGIEHLYLGG